MTCPYHTPSVSLHYITLHSSPYLRGTMQSPLNTELIKKNCRPSKGDERSETTCSEVEGVLTLHSTH